MRTARGRLPVAAVAILAVAGCGGPGPQHASKATTAAAIGTLELRAVASMNPGHCTADPLTSPAAGAACDLDGTATYHLGPALGVLSVTQARLSTASAAVGGQRILARVDPASAATLQAVTRRLVGTRLALVLGGRVATAPTITGPVRDGQLQLAASSNTALRQISHALGATGTPGREPTEGVAGGFPVGIAQQRALCRRAQPRIAPGMRVDTTTVAQATLTAADAARWATGLHDAAGAAMWWAQPPGERVYLCNYDGPKPKHPRVPSCPPGQIPVVDGLGESRSFLVDAHGHATELTQPDVQPSCLAN